MAEDEDPIRRAREIDREIGARLRELRMFRGVSQEELGHCLGITFQQVQKYEKGTNRISPGRLCLAAEFLDVPVNAFFEQLSYELPDSAIPSRARLRWYELYDKLPEDVRSRLLQVAGHM